MTNEINQETAEVAPPIIKKTDLLNKIWPMLTLLIFVLVYYLFYGPTGISDITNQAIINIFTKYAPYVGWLAGIISLVIFYILVLIKRIAHLTKFIILNPLLLALSFLPWYLFSRQLIFFEPRFTDIARAIISYIGEPLLVASKGAGILSAIWLAYIVIKKIIKK